MEDRIGLVYSFVMERCLWQFFSRNWDREENIRRIMGDVAKIQSGQEVDRSTNIANSHYADAKILASQLSQRFDWFDGLSWAKVNEICDGVIEKLMDIAVVNSLNAERNESKY
ncbi:MAG: Fe-only/vanadium nitrogenase subunit delta [Clostridiales bacterium]|jgi:hypothetical protein|nr:Fe-only/vanadium nitrogenase subunit delta [Clostridiales bacterium]